MLSSYQKNEVDIDHEFKQICPLLDTRKQNELACKLEKFEYFIAIRGLNDEHFGALIDFFLTADLGIDLRSRIISCLVPQSVIDDECLRKSVMWVLKNALTNTNAVGHFLGWVKAIAKFKLADLEFLKKYYDFFIKIMYIHALVKPLCSVLELLTDSTVVTASNVSLVILAFQNTDRHPRIGQLLRQMASINPNLVPAAFHKPFKPLSEPLTATEIVLKKCAIRLKIDWKSQLHHMYERQYLTCSESLILPKEPNLISHRPIVKDPGEDDRQEIKKREKGKRKCYYPNSIEENEITMSNSMIDLGRNICLGKNLPKNHLDLLSSQEGVMALLAHGPTPKFLAELKNRLETRPHDVVESVVVLQPLAKCGLPPVFDYLSTFLVTWDGFYNENIVYDLLPWLHFETFDRLRERILTPLARVYVTSSSEVKVKIVNALLALVINLVTTQSQGNTQHSENEHNSQWMANPSEIEAFIDTISSLIFTGILLEGVNCNVFLIHGLNFYYKIAKLFLRGDLHFFTVPPELVSFSALCSLDPTVLNDLCLLFTVYKKEVVPFIESKGSLDSFGLELEMIERVSNNIYDYIWATESGMHMSQLHGTSMISRTIGGSEGAGRKHLALRILAEALCSRVNQNLNLSKLTRSDLLRIFGMNAKQIADFIALQERNHVE